MHEQSLNTSISSELRKDKSMQKLLTNLLGMLLMFFACLLVCHSPELVSVALKH